MMTKRYFLFLLFVIALSYCRAITTFTVTSNANSGAGSLRQAITDANTNPGRDTIIFRFITTNTIVPQTMLPALSDNSGTVIDGFSATGAAVNTTPVFSVTSLSPLNPVYRVVIQNTFSVSVQKGLVISGDNNVVNGLIIHSFGILSSDPNSVNIEIRGNNNLVKGCYIGTPDGINSGSSKTFSCIRITGNNNTIGDGTTAGMNLISGMRNSMLTSDLNSAAINIGGLADGNVVKGNIIGLKKSGDGIPFSQLMSRGISLMGTSANTTIGGDDIYDGNVISGAVPGSVATTHTGIYTQTSGNNIQILGNRIGTSANGLSPVSNRNGITIDGTNGMIIGKNSPNGRNVISGNTYGGIYIGNSMGHTIVNNYIGPNANGTALNSGNQSYGIIDFWGGSGGYTIGGTTAGDGNVISGNINGVVLASANNNVIGNIVGLSASGSNFVSSQIRGIYVFAGFIKASCDIINNIVSGNIKGIEVLGYASNVNIKGNIIGPDKNLNEVSGTQQTYGIYFGAGASGSFNTGNYIGGCDSGDPNVIGFNTCGIFVSGPYSNQQFISRNVIYGSTSSPMTKAIELTNMGNDEYASPSITSADSMFIQGTSANDGDSIEVFETDNCINALRYIGTTVVSGGVWTLTVTSSMDVHPGDRLIATVRNVGGNTSEFSSCFCTSPVLSVSPDISICSQEYTILSASGAGLGGTYTWTPTIHLSSASGNITSTTILSSSQDYTLVATTLNGCSSRTATISVSVFALPTFSINNPNNTICSGITADVNLISDFSNVNYSWSPSNNLSASTGSIVTYLSSEGGIHSYSVNAELYGCYVLQSFTIETHSLPTISLGPDQNICFGVNTSLSVVGSLGQYVWSPVAYLDVTTGASVTFSPPQASSNYTYLVTAIDGQSGCSSVDSINLSVVPSLTANAGVDIEICSGESPSLLGQGGQSYIWQPSVGITLTNSAATTFSLTSPGTYTYILTAFSGNCFDMDTLTVSVNSLPTVTSSGDQSVCLGNSTFVSAYGAASYYWTPFEGLNTSADQSVVASPSSTKTYSVTGIDNNGCSGMAAITVVVNVFPLPTIFASPNQNVCAGNSVILTADGLSSALPIDYIWQPSFSVGSSLYVSPQATTTYTVFGTDQNGCYGSFQTSVNMISLPTVNAGTDITVLEGTLTTIEATGSGTDYSWTPSTGLDCANCLNPKFAAAQNISYVIVANNNGCTSTDTIIVFVKELLCSEPFIPTAFSPNNDGENDELFIIANCIEEFELDIFDRWGNKVYSSKTIAEPWNGKNKFDKDLPTGIYVYDIKVDQYDTKEYRKTGNISLIR